MFRHSFKLPIRSSRLLNSSRILQRKFLHNRIVPNSSPDFMISSLNGAMDLSVRVTSCKAMLQERVDKQKLSDDSAKLLGDSLVTMAMMCCGLKGEEGRQLSLVGNSTEAISHVVVTGNANHELRGKISKIDYQIPSQYISSIPSDSISSYKLPLSLYFGDEIGQVQVQKTHPTWKEPSLGVTELDPTLSFATNLALYMTHSEQRQSAIHTEVDVKDGKVISALGLWVERLPCANEENIDKVIENFSNIQKKTMKSYIDETSAEYKEKNITENTSEEIPSVEEEALHRVVDDCLKEMVEDGIRWAKSCSYKCNCSIEKVWGILEILPKKEIVDIIKKGEGVEMFCDFCGSRYNITSEEISDHDFTK